MLQYSTFVCFCFQETGLLFCFLLYWTHCPPVSVHLFRFNLLDNCIQDNSPVKHRKTLMCPSYRNMTSQKVRRLILVMLFLLQSSIIMFVFSNFIILYLVRVHAGGRLQKQNNLSFFLFLYFFFKKMRELKIYLLWFSQCLYYCFIACFPSSPKL